MPPTHPSLADVATAYRTLIAHETEPKERDFYRTRLQRLEQATESLCEFDCRRRVAAAGVGVCCPQCSVKCADTDLATQLARAIRAAWVDRLDWDELAHAALEFLTSAGRLIPSGGMALTAEQVEDVRTVVSADAAAWNRLSPALFAAYRLRRALFPATEPAEDAPCAICNVNETNHAGVSYYHPFTTEPGPFDDEGNDRPAPAEPTEEETKAVTFDEIAQSLKRIGDAESSFGFNLRFWRRIAEKLIAKYPHLASAPVVPAPTETGPWQRIEDIPDGVEEVSDCDGHLWWLSRNVVEEWHFDGTDPSGTKQFKDPSDFAPLFAIKDES